MYKCVHINKAKASNLIVKHVLITQHIIVQYLIKGSLSDAALYKILKVHLTPKCVLQYFDMFGFTQILSKSKCAMFIF